MNLRTYCSELVKDSAINNAVCSLKLGDRGKALNLGLLNGSFNRLYSLGLPRGEMTTHSQVQNAATETARRGIALAKQKGYGPLATELEGMLATYAARARNE